MWEAAASHINNPMIPDVITSTQLDPIKHLCSTFIREAGTNFLVKGLPSSYPDVKKVKVRHRRARNSNDPFNMAFNDVKHQIKQTALIANWAHVSELQDGHDIFYVFPINGYKYLYSPNPIIDLDVDRLSDDIVADLIKMKYYDTNLQKSIIAGNEILFHNIPAYFALRASAVGNYSDVFAHLTYK